MAELAKTLVGLCLAANVLLTALTALVAVSAYDGTPGATLRLMGIPLLWGGFAITATVLLAALPFTKDRVVVRLWAGALVLGIIGFLAGGVAVALA